MEGPLRERTSPSSLSSQKFERPPRCLSGFRQHGNLGALCVLLAGCEAGSALEASGGAFPNLRQQFPFEQSTIGLVANQGSDTVSVIDLERFELLGEVPVGRDPVDRDGPTSTVVDRGRGVAYILLTYPDSSQGPHSAQFGVERPGFIQTLALNDLRPVAEVRVNASPFQLEQSADKVELLVTHNNTTLPLVEEDPFLRRATVARVDLEASFEVTELPVCITPVGFDFTGPSRVLVACLGDDALVELDVNSGEIVQSVDIDVTAPQKPFALRVDPSGGEVAVAYQLTRKVALSGLDSLGQPRALVDLGAVPSSLTWLSEGRVIVSVRSPDGARLVDTTMGQVIASVDYASECESPSAFTVGPGEQLYLVCSGDGFSAGSLAVVDSETLQIGEHLLLGRGPDRLAVSVP
jgi:DNA-binding beta-propeller fold protein YncE